MYTRGKKRLSCGVGKVTRTMKKKKNFKNHYRLPRRLHAAAAPFRVFRYSKLNRCRSTSCGYRNGVRMSIKCSRVWIFSKSPKNRIPLKPGGINRTRSTAQPAHACSILSITLTSNVYSPGRKMGTQRPTLYGCVRKN